MTGAEKALVVLIIALVVVCGWAAISFIMGLRPTVGIFS